MMYIQIKLELILAEEKGFWKKGGLEGERPKYTYAFA